MGAGNAKDVMNGLASWLSLPDCSASKWGRREFTTRLGLLSLSFGSICLHSWWALKRNNRESKILLESRTRLV